MQNEKLTEKVIIELEKAGLTAVQQAPITVYYEDPVVWDFVFDPSFQVKRKHRQYRPRSTPATELVKESCQSC